MTIIKITDIPYLTEEVIEKYKNAIVVSAEGMIIKMNSLMLCAISRSIKMALNDDCDDYVIITEFTLEELKQLKAYYIGGVSEKISESMIKSFGLKRINDRNNAMNQKQRIIDDDNFIDNNMKKDHDFILKTPDHLIAVVEPLENSMNISTTADIIPMEIKTSLAEDEDMKNESFDQNIHNIKDEFINDGKEFDFDLEYFSDDSVGDPTVEEIITDEKNEIETKKKLSEDDIDWEPGKHSKREYKYFFKELSQKDLKLLKTFELPKSLESYKRKPKNLLHLKKNKIEETKNDETKPFQCSQCSLRVPTEMHIKSHIIKHHFEHLRCPYCDSLNGVFHLEDVDEFKKHIFVHFNISKHAEKYKTGCIQCGKHDRPDKLTKHLKQRGPLHNDECSQCSRKMASFHEYQNHVNDQHYGVWKYKCGYCSLIFDDRKECLRHTRKVHRQHEFKLKPTKEQPVKSKVFASKVKIKGVCHLCGSNSNDIKWHMYYNHSTSDPILCTQCDQLFPTQQKLNGHMRNIHIKTPCPHCGVLVTKKTLHRHILQKHTANHEKPYQCQEKDCGKGFLTKTALDEHMNVHTGEKPFKCKYCPAAYGSFGTKAMHERGHLGIKRKPKKG